ncbi:hypothetical protein DL96DRAFT_1610789 [Flagelloscypha sp. PMI_526]|nr:hypothetical protein DL96DRAFT_1610789 [Flagelloscypha sp. PMI_526]
MNSRTEVIPDLAWILIVAGIPAARRIHAHKRRQHYTGAHETTFLCQYSFMLFPTIVFVIVGGSV